MAIWTQSGCANLHINICLQAGLSPGEGSFRAWEGSREGGCRWGYNGEGSQGLQMRAQGPGQSVAGGIVVSRCGDTGLWGHSNSSLSLLVQLRAGRNARRHSKCGKRGKTWGHHGPLGLDSVCCSAPRARAPLGTEGGKGHLLTCLLIAFFQGVFTCPQ